MLSDLVGLEARHDQDDLGLNAPYGSRCFLTYQAAKTLERGDLLRLNAPYGARCFLTCRRESVDREL